MARPDPRPLALMSQFESRFGHGIRLHESQSRSAAEQGKIMLYTLRRDLDPLDLEVLERAFEGAWVAVKENGTLADFDSDEALEAALRHELTEIARFAGVTDPETLRDILLAAVG